MKRQLGLALGFAALNVMFAAAEPVSVPYSPPAQSTPLESTFVDWDALTPRATPIGQYWSIFDNPTPTLEKLEVHATLLRPGMESHAVHRHPWEELILVKEGNLEASINGQTHRVGPGFLIFLASNDPHNVRNVGDTPATYYVINFCTDQVQSLPPTSAAEQAVPGMLPSCVIDCDSLPAAPTKIGFHTSVLDSKTLTFLRLESHITTLAVGQHTTPNNGDPGDELFIVKSGALEARINGVERRLNQGSLLYCAPNNSRAFGNIGDAPVTYQVIKVISDRSPEPAKG